MKLRACAAFVIGALGTATPAIAASEITDIRSDSTVETGDMLQLVIPLSGYMAAWMHDDWEGAKQLTYSVLASQIIVDTTKKIVGRQRPSGTSPRSYPSGHAAAGFSGAHFLQMRYGAEWGVPAYAAASYVAYSRVHGKRHFVSDVTASAGISFLVNQYFVSPYANDGVYLNAQQTEDGMSLNVTVTEAAFNQERSSKDRIQTVATPLKNKIEVGLGSHLNFFTEDLVMNQNFSDATQVDKLQPYTRITYSRELANSNALDFEFIPTELRVTGKAKQDFSYQDKDYAKGESLVSEYRHYMLGGNVYKGYTPLENLDVKFGLGVYAHQFGYQVANADSLGQHAKREYLRILPAMTARATYTLWESVAVTGEYRFQSWEKNSHNTAKLGVNYQINRAWDVGLNYLASSTNLPTSVEFDEVGYDNSSVELLFSNRF
ncbi:phosphatase PAP2 family protein [Vibrio sp. vnigr-6D03]|uniref:phosphatase PAP2 family protein n=1 Tax=Vibrio sp. vnigr-6D03 TaxID=2058088 RepID=UPI00191C6FBA|nr:phosphatase PAP2 family protein [Vibrio sp. vnigr-6D03]